FYFPFLPSFCLNASTKGRVGPVKMKKVVGHLVQAGKAVSICMAQQKAAQGKIHPVHVYGKQDAVPFVNFKMGKTVGVVHVAKFVKGTDFYAHLTHGLNGPVDVEGLPVVVDSKFRPFKLSVHPAVHLQGSDGHLDRKSTRLNSSHVKISYAVF